MIPGFPSYYVSCMCDGDGRNFKVLVPIDYHAKDGTVYRIPKGASTDGASTPAILWNKIPPFGDYWLPALLHDSGYQNTLYRVTDGSGGVQTVKAGLDKVTCDNLLKEAMELCHVDPVMIELIYEGVRVGGQSSFNEDRGIK